MSKLSIRGHATRGKEVIEILEMLGGNNPREYVADCDCFGFYISDETRNIYYDWFYNLEGKDVAIFNLEKFLEKFPYKVGDKVRIPEYESEVRISNMFWNGNEVLYVVVTDEAEWYSANELNEFNEPNNPNKEETMDKAVFDANAQCCDIMNRLIKKKTIEGKITMNEDKGTLVAIDLTRELKKEDEIEVILGDYEFVLKDGKTYFVKRCKCPKTYEECCKILNIPVNGDIVYAGNWTDGGEYLDKHLDTLRKFQQILICRDAYWKMAGEQMGLDEPWKPNWKNGLSKFCIANCEGKILRGNYGSANFILAFPTEEMRDAFYNNFKELIELCKELL